MADNNVDTTMAKIASYIELTQPIIDEANENRTRFIKKASEVANVLVERGILSQGKRDTFLAKVAADKSGTCVWDLVVKMAEVISADNMGAPAEDIKTAGADTSSMDAWERWIMYGNPEGQARSNGNVE